MAGKAGRISRRCYYLKCYACCLPDWQECHWQLKGQIRSIGVNDGSLLSSREDKLTGWVEYFNEVLDRPVLTTSVHINDPLGTLLTNTEKFTEVEVRKGIKVLKNNKLPSLEGNITEMLKAGGKTVILWMCGLCNQVWKSDLMPMTGRMGPLYVMPK